MEGKPGSARAIFLRRCRAVLWWLVLVKILKWEVSLLTLHGFPRSLLSLRSCLKPLSIIRKLTQCNFWGSTSCPREACGNTQGERLDLRERQQKEASSLLTPLPCREGKKIQDAEWQKAGKGEGRCRHQPPSSILHLALSPEAVWKHLWGSSTTDQPL